MGCVATEAIFESLPAAAEERDECSSSSGVASCSSSSFATASSIGKNSDVSSDDDNCEDDGEVQSCLKQSYAMDSLEEALPMRRGISQFYNGKSKSYTSLAEASSTPNITDIVKPENAYTRRRRNLLAFNHVWDKNRSFPHRSSGGGISKRPISSSKSMFALAVAMSSSESICSTSEDSSSSSVSKSPPHLPPLHPRPRTHHSNLASPNSPRLSFLPCLSFSIADFEHCAPTSDKVDTNLKF